jgi:hypothetical protein
MNYILIESFYKLVSLLPQKWVKTPSVINIVREREKFMASRTYNPIFLYKEKGLSYLEKAWENLYKLLDWCDLTVTSNDLSKYMVGVLSMYEVGLRLQASIGDNELFPK